MFTNRKPTIEAYEHNAPMRARYIEVNSLTHVEVWQKDDGYFCPAMCTSDGIGFAEEGRPFETEHGVVEWAARYCPELPVR